MSEVKVWTKKTIIPTYEIGEAEKNPIFIDKRVYQGSSGKVYPYPTIEKISDTKVDKEYTAVYLENEYLKVMVLPELGGRIQRAYDKTNDYDFVYYNHVIKPALVGLTGPWISGGIEFNWPQHHRPTTFLPVDFLCQENEDGSKSVLIHDVDQMYGTKGIAKYTLYPGKSYIEITGQLYNRTSMPQTFLWWANPAVPVNDNTQSIFPPDVHAVMDHGKRDVSRFPIATGVYYKKDYSEGVDISRYKNIPVPTSYMAEKSKYDFVGGYDYGKAAGILHVSDHHISTGKKQWTWGCGDFGKAWDRNLTDEDGPYVELMTGMYCDNQPDFTWLAPFEEKVFTQYFMPYKAVGQVKNATKEAAVNLDYNGKRARVIVYATSVYENARVVLLANETVVLSEEVTLSPNDIYDKGIPCAGYEETELKVCVYEGERLLVSYQPEKQEMNKTPEPAKAAKEPAEIMTNEELYLTGLHIEQYRHATYRPDPYYLEGLKRDAGDIRINNAYGELLMRRGAFKEAEGYFRKALERLIERNPNPYNSESYYLLGLDLFYQERYEKAYDAFYKATWSAAEQEMSFYYLAAIDAKAGRFEKAMEHISRALVKNADNIKARGMKAYLYRKLGAAEKAQQMIADNLVLDPFDFVSAYEAIIQCEADEKNHNKYEQMILELNVKMRNFPENYLMCARDYAEFGAYEEAIGMLQECTKEYPMLYYYEAYYLEQLGCKNIEIYKKAEETSSDYCFPNKLEDITVLKASMKAGYIAKAAYYLGNLYYDKRQYDEAISCWEASEVADPAFATTHRNLALAYYNQRNEENAALTEMEQAFALNDKDVRVFLELDQLYKKLGRPFEERLDNYEVHLDIIESQDNVYVEYITLLNMCGKYEEAYEKMMKHKFHPWEGGEGKITTQYTLALLQMVKKELKEEHAKEAENLLRKALIYPENLGEGKLEGTKDNHLYYHLGLALEMQGRVEEAHECFGLATLGTDEPAGAMYYNDQPADMILYQGLAYEKLGKEKEAKSRFYRLIDYGEQHLEDEGKIEYFAVSLPEFMIFDEDVTVRNKAHCYYLLALGNIGLKDTKKMQEYLKQANRIEPAHMMCNIYSKDLSILCDN